MNFYKKKNNIKVLFSSFMLSLLLDTYWKPKIGKLNMIYFASLNTKTKRKNERKKEKKRILAYPEHNATTDGK